MLVELREQGLEWGARRRREGSEVTNESVSGVCGASVGEVGAGEKNDGFRARRKLLMERERIETGELTSAEGETALSNGEAGGEGVRRRGSCVT